MSMALRLCSKTARKRSARSEIRSGVEALTVPFGWESIAIPEVLGTGGYWRVARRPSVQPSDAKPGAAGPVVSPVRGIEFRLDADDPRWVIADELCGAKHRTTLGERLLRSSAAPATA